MEKNKKILVYFLIAIIVGFGAVIINNILHNVNAFDIETAVFGTGNFFTILIIEFHNRKYI